MEKTALVVVDMVKDFTSPKGLVYYPQNEKILPIINQVVTDARNNDILIIFLQHRYRANKLDKNLLNMRPNCIEGSGGEELDDIFDVQTQDYVIPKRRYSGFFGTDLDSVLREHKVSNVIVVGTKTNCCIRATVTDAYNLDYSPIVIKECVATNSEASNEMHLDEINRYLGKVISLNEFYEQFINRY